MTTRHRLPDFVAAAPLNILMTLMRLDRDDPRDVLLGATYQLAAHLERRMAPWDAQGLAVLGASYGARLPAGAYGVCLDAQVVGRDGLGEVA